MKKLSELSKSLGMPPSEEVADEKAEKKIEKPIEESSSESIDDLSIEREADPIERVKNDSIERVKKEEPEKKDKEQQFGELRKRKDELLSQVESIAKYLEERTGEKPEDFIKSIEKLSDKSELEKKLSEKEERLKMLDIKSSDEWKTQYEEPYNDAVSSLYAGIVNLDDEGKPKNESLTQQLMQILFKKVAEDDGKVDHVAIRGLIKSFSTKYNEVTGEDFEEPKIGDVVSSLKFISKKDREAQEAIKNWSETKSSLQERLQAEKAEITEKANRENRSSRNKLASKALNEFDYSSNEGVFDETFIEDVIKQTYKEQEEAFSDPSKMPTYDVVIQNMSKARMYDDLLSKHRELMKELSEIRDTGRITRSQSTQNTERHAESGLVGRLEKMLS